jgi:hypothetical protein
VTIEFNTDYASPGESLSCTARICNPDDPRQDVPFVGMLDLGIGEYWFYPSWEHWPPDFDWKALVLPSGTTDVALLPEFVWPDTGGDNFGPITIWGALLNEGMTAIEGRFGSDEFAYGPSR